MAKPSKQPADATAEQQRAIQRDEDRRAKPAAKQKQKNPIQTGTRAYPGGPLPDQHLEKPGNESEMLLKPRFEAPDYRGSGKLDGRVAIITGGDSGIGRAVAVLFAREGADIALVYLNEHKDAKETRRHVEAEGRKCLLLSGDVRDAAFCEGVAKKVKKTLGHIDILVNNAAFQEHAESLLELSEERFDLTMKTNIYGYFHMAKAVLPYLEHGAAIINTGSVTGLKGSKHLLDYSTTKGAIHAFTMSLAANLLPQGIRVNAVAPGPVWTPLNPADQSPEKIREFGQSTDLHRPAQPEEISPAYVFLASPVCSSFITGIVLPITGSVGE